MTALVDNIAFLLSRISFVMSHVAFAVWILFVTNDPFNFRSTFPNLINTLDVDLEDLQDCIDLSFTKTIDYDAVWYNTWTFLVVWWLPHSLLARNAVKKAIGLGPTHPLDRPIYAFLAPFTWWAALALWKPVSSCSRLDVTTITLTGYMWRLPIVLTFLVEILGLFYLLPNHVFGTDRHTWSKQMPEQQELLIQFPYAFVRHPAAAAILWFYWVAIPSYNANHLWNATLWSVFILVGTLVFEEGGLRGQKGEFGKEYAEYSQKVNAFWPSMWSIQHKFGLVGDQDEKGKEEY